MFKIHQIAGDPPASTEERFTLSNPASRLGEGLGPFSDYNHKHDIRCIQDDVNIFGASLLGLDLVIFTNDSSVDDVNVCRKQRNGA